MLIEKEKYLLHEPNLVICHVSCDLCTDSCTLERNADNCQLCGQHEHVFFGMDCVERFTDLVTNGLNERCNMWQRKMKQNPQIRCFAANSKGYDSIFLMRQILKQNLAPAVIRQGTKFLMIKFGKRIRFLDSHAFIQLTLKKYPSALGFEGRKGFFPYLMNRPENFTPRIWERPNHPDRSLYSPEEMSPNDMKEFDEWYEKNNHLPFNIKDQLIQYCRWDVEILERGVLKFRQLIKKVGGIDPSTRACTIAGVGMEIFRSQHLQPSQIPIVPLDGYTPHEHVSKASQEWLNLVEHDRRITLSREVPIPGTAYKADGFLPNPMNEYPPTVF